LFRRASTYDRRSFGVDFDGFDPAKSIERIGALQISVLWGLMPTLNDEKIAFGRSSFCICATFPAGINL
ncbi:MAG: hypothetical protein IJO51_02140, partial [Clostridia bacterium]|nr:hypothetical protein [Clostridia bacterium]